MQSDKEQRKIDFPFAFSNISESETKETPHIENDEKFSQAKKDENSYISSIEDLTNQLQSALTDLVGVDKNQASYSNKHKEVAELTEDTIVSQTALVNLSHGMAAYKISHTYERFKAFSAEVQSKVKEHIDLLESKSLHLQSETTNKPIEPATKTQASESSNKHIQADPIQEDGTSSKQRKKSSKARNKRLTRNLQINASQRVIDVAETSFQQKVSAPEQAIPEIDSTKRIVQSTSNIQEQAPIPDKIDQPTSKLDADMVSKQLVSAEVQSKPKEHTDRPQPSQLHTETSHPQNDIPALETQGLQTQISQIEDDQSGVSYLNERINKSKLLLSELKANVVEIQKLEDDLMDLAKNVENIALILKYYDKISQGNSFIPQSTHKNRHEVSSHTLDQHRQANFPQELKKLWEYYYQWQELSDQYNKPTEREQKLSDLTSKVKNHVQDWAKETITATNRALKQFSAEVDYTHKTHVLQQELKQNNQNILVLQNNQKIYKTLLTLIKQADDQILQQFKDHDNKISNVDSVKLGLNSDKKKELVIMLIEFFDYRILEYDRHIKEVFR